MGRVIGSESRVANQHDAGSRVSGLDFLHSSHNVGGVQVILNRHWQDSALHRVISANVDGHQLGSRAEGALSDGVVNLAHQGLLRLSRHESGGAIAGVVVQFKASLTGNVRADVRNRNWAATTARHGRIGLARVSSEGIAEGNVVTSRKSVGNTASQEGGCQRRSCSCRGCCTANNVVLHN